MITLISLVGVALGVMVLIVVLSVHNGFERTMKEILLGSSPHVKMHWLADDGKIYDFAEQEEILASKTNVESAYSVVEGFVLLDSKAWQRPVYFRAINTENEDQVATLSEMLDLDDYPESKVDLYYEGDTNVVVSKQIAQALHLKVGDEIRLLAASNLDEVLKAYNVPDERAWDLYPEVFTKFETEMKSVFVIEGGVEKGDSEKLTKAYREFQVLIPGWLNSPDGEVEIEGEEMRSVEREEIENILIKLKRSTRQEAGFDFYPSGTQADILSRLEALKNLDLKEVDNENFREMEQFVVPKTLKVQGVYRDAQRAQGPGLFLSLTIGQELKNLQGGVESIGLRIEDPYQAEQVAVQLQEEMGDEWFAQSWMTIHAEQFGLMKTEKLMISFALSFITLLSAFSIMAVMYTVTVQKRQEIGVMKALGARPSQIVRVFLYQGLIVGVVGALLGLGLGLLAIEYRELIVSGIRMFGVDPFPAQFHGMTELPAHVVWLQVEVICAVAIVLCLLAALVPALVAAFRDPAKSLRNL